MDKSELFRSNVDTVILKVLFDGDRYGYDMIKQINEKSGGQWEVKQATLYACLKKLQKQGFVSSYWDSSESNGGRRKYYTLTDAGRDVFVSYKNEWERSRDLFGGLISDEDPYMPPPPVYEDFSDVDDEDYAIPKRKATRTKKQKANVLTTEPTPDIAPTEFTPNDYSVTINVSPNEQNNSDETVQTQPIPENVVTDETVSTDENSSTSSLEEQTAVTEKNDADTLFELPPQPSDTTYVQQSMFDEPTVANDNLNQSTTKEDEYPSTFELPPEQSDCETPFDKSVTTNNTINETFTPQKVLNPQSIINDLYSSSFTTNRSYADAKKSGVIYDEETVEDIQSTNDATTTQQNIEQQNVSTQPQPTTALQPYNDTLPTPAEESPAKKAYKSILSDLIERSEARNEAERNEREEELQRLESQEDDDITEDTAATASQFSEVKQSIYELGNDVIVHEHDDTPKQYAHKYHYYSNRLMFTHYGIMCALMFAIGIIGFFTFYYGLGMRMKYDYLLYMGLGLLPIIMFVVAVIKLANDPEKKKRVNVNFKFSIVIRTIIMIQIAVIIYCLNLIWGMPTSFSASYIPSLVLPAIYALFVPISELIFMGLLKSQRYAA